MQTFIRVTEIWVPSSSGHELELQGGDYGDLAEFREFSIGVKFPYGVGLPGLAWERKRPVVLKDFEGDVFQRTKEARAAGLTSAVAVPILNGEFVRAVLVFLCGHAERLSGAIEVWSRSGRLELALADGYYGDLQKFERLSRSIRFQRGRGLPGAVWDQEFPCVMEQLNHSSSFLRATEAADAGITTGIGLPLFDGEGFCGVLAFLSSHSTPIARRFEIWKPDEARECLEFAGAVQESDAADQSEVPPGSIPRGEGPVGGVWQTGLPELVRQSTETLLAIPVIDRGRLNSVVACYW